MVWLPSEEKCACVWARDCHTRSNQWCQVEHDRGAKQGERQKGRRPLCTSAHLSPALKTHVHPSLCLMDSLCSQKLSAASHYLRIRPLYRGSFLGGWSGGWFSGEESPVDKQFLCHCLSIIMCPLRGAEMRFLQQQGMQARTSLCHFQVSADRKRWHLVKRRVRDDNG